MPRSEGPEWGANEEKVCKMVFIGKALARQEIEERFLQVLQPLKLNLRPALAVPVPSASAFGLAQIKGGGRALPCCGSMSLPKPPSSIANGDYTVEKMLGAGCFGQVWRGWNRNKDLQVAVKFEDNQGKSSSLQLHHEQEMPEVLSLLANTSPQGFAKLLAFTVEGRFSCLVMEMLGFSLEDRLQGCGGKFSAPTCVLIADQCLRRIEYLHSLGILHRDIKPENFMFGVKNRIHVIHLIDFGLSKRYYEGRHAAMRSCGGCVGCVQAERVAFKAFKAPTNLSLTGTARYASINAHRGIEQSRRDDLEAIGHMLMCFLRGTLPWSGLQAKTQEEKYRKIREKKEWKGRKEQTPLEELCADFPDAFRVYLVKARALQFTDRPDYNALRRLFSDLRQEIGPQEDHGFQFLKGSLGSLEPLEIKEDVVQPDDQIEVKSSSGCCTIS
eukprot:g25909.t1